MSKNIPLKIIFKKSGEQNAISKKTYTVFGNDKWNDHQHR